MAFTNYITKITEVGNTTNNTHDLVDTSASHYVKGTQTSSTNAWTGALPDGVTAYYDGLSIDYFLPYAGTSTAATLNLGSKGAKPVYVGNGTSGVTTHYPANSVIHLTYIINSNLNSGKGCWKADAYYNTNTTYSAGTGISLSGTTFSAKLGFTTSGNNRAVLADTDGKLYVTQKDDDTNTKVTSSANHYTPSTASGNDKTASATGATAAWSIDVVKGITINTDGKGHITGLSVTSGKIPANPNTDTKVSTAAVTSGVTYYPVVGADTTSAATKFYDKTGITYSVVTGTTQDEGTALLTLGNSTAEGTAGNKTGYLVLYAPNGKKNTLIPGDGATVNIQISLPNATGTLLSTSNLSYTTSGNNRAVSKDSSGNLYVVQKDTNTYVTQTANTTVTWRKVLGTYNGGTNATTTVTSGSTNVAYFKNGDGPAFHTSTGAFYATSYFMGLETTDALYTAIDGLGWTADVIL